MNSVGESGRFRLHTPLPLDGCLYALQATIPELTRCAPHHCP